MTTGPHELAGEAAAQLRDLYGDRIPTVFVVLGSGWDVAVDHLGVTVEETPTSGLAGAVGSTVPGHSSNLRLIDTGEGHALVARGRVHLYEGHDPSTVVHLLRAVIASGVGRVILTNAAGSLDPALGPGTPVMIRDHINLTGLSPMWGPAPPDGASRRFVDMTDAYSPRLREIARSVEPGLSEGVYAGLHGPEFETPAEIEMVRTIGGSLVGMSTVLETIAARHLGAEVLGMSLVTNFAAGMKGPLAHDDVVETAARAGDTVGPLLARIARRLV